MNDKKTRIELALIDVRKSYRLLYIYQRRILDIVQQISFSISWTYAGGWAKFSSPSPRNGKGALNNWAWDWLNMYCYEFYLGEKTIDGNLIKLSIWIVSDSGFYDSEIEEKTNIEGFDSVEASISKFVFVVGKNTWHTYYNDFEDNLKRSASEYIKRNDNGILVAKSFKISDFTNGDEIRLRIEELVSFCNRNGISEVAS